MDAPFPNRVRELRLARLMTREALSEATKALEASDSAAYGSVSARTLERIETGKARPRVRPAAAIAKALEAEPGEVFPHGPDDGLRNPSGTTRIPPDRPSPGRPRKIT